jgi:hypothetical protein
MAARRALKARLGDTITQFSIDSVKWFRADDRIVMADLIDGRSLYLHARMTIRLLAAEFAADFVCCSPGLLVKRSLMMSYTQAARAEGGGGWLRIAGHGKSIRVTDSFRLEVAEAVTLRRIEIALTGPCDVKVKPEDAYAEGKQARACNANNSPPSGLDRVLRGWWMAGWNDADIELSK